MIFKKEVYYTSWEVRHTSFFLMMVSNFIWALIFDIIEWFVCVCYLCSM